MLLLQTPPFRTPALLTVALALVALAGCDYGNDDLVVVGNDVIVRTFSVDGSDYDVDATGTVASYQRDVDELTAEVADDGAVLLYAGDEILWGENLGTWTALPTAVGTDEDGDGLVDITVSYTFSYDLQDLYVDVIASSPIVFPDAEYRLVLIPGDLFVGSTKVGVDFSDYEAVRRAFDLPE